MPSARSSDIDEDMVIGLGGGMCNCLIIDWMVWGKVNELGKCGAEVKELQETRSLC